MRRALDAALKNDHLDQLKHELYYSRNIDNSAAFDIHRANCHFHRRIKWKCVSRGRAAARPSTVNSLLIIRCANCLDLIWSTWSIFEISRVPTYHDESDCHVAFLRIRPQGGWAPIRILLCNNGTNRFGLIRAFERWSYCQFWWFGHFFRKSISSCLRLSRPIFDRIYWQQVL